MINELDEICRLAGVKELDEGIIDKVKPLTKKAVFISMLVALLMTGACSKMDIDGAIAKTDSVTEVLTMTEPTRYVSWEEYKEAVFTQQARESWLGAGTPPAEYIAKYKSTHDIYGEDMAYDYWQEKFEKNNRDIMRQARYDDIG